MATASTALLNSAADRAGAPSSAFPSQAGCCRLTTFAWGGAEFETSARLGLGKGRVYVRLPATSPALERIWNSARARVAPCTSGGRPTGTAVEGAARVLAGDEDAPARRALAGGRLADRLPRDEDNLYVEIVPAGC